MELRHLRYFYALGQTLSFTRAAAALHMSQPPFSRQISQLESILGVELVVRERPIRLTDAGRFLFEQVGELMGKLEQITEDTKRIAQGQRRWLGIGFAPSTLYGGLPALIQRLRYDQNLELSLVEMTTVQQVEALKKGQIDVAFGRLSIDDVAIKQKVLRQDPLVAVLPLGHRLVNGFASLRELAAEPLVLYPGKPRPSYADQVLALFTQRGLEVSICQWVNELQTAIGLVAAGVGVAIVPAAVQQQHRDDLLYVPISDPDAVSPLILSHRALDNRSLLLECLEVFEAGLKSENTVR